jgi:putative endonuclease
MCNPLRVPKPQWHIYLIRTGDGNLYAGITTDVARRFAEHETGSGRCARYLRGRAPLQLVFRKRLGSQSLALKAEWRTRRLPKHQKEEIVRFNPSKRELMARLAIEHGSGS